MHDTMNDTYQELRRTAVDELKQVESCTRRELEDLQLERLNEQLRHACRESPFYRALSRRWGFPERLAAVEVLSRFPFTTKEDLREQYPFGMLAVPRSELIRYGESTGTSGRPTSSFITFEDWIRGNVWVEHALRHAFSAEDTAFIAIPYELTFASYDIDRALENLGVTVVAVGTLNQVCPFERMIEMMREVHPTVLVCTPTRALRLHDLLVRAGRSPAEVGLRTLLYVGETCSPARLRKVADTWQVRLCTAYGSTETNSLALPCRLGSSHLIESRYLFEVINPDTGSPVPQGVDGELVLTSLTARAMPLLRYRTGDLVRIDEQPCGCGSPLRVLQHQGRVGEGFQVDGRSLPRLHLEETVMSTPGTGVYYVAGVRDGRLRVYVELDADTDAAGTCALVRERVRDAHGIDAHVEPVARQAVTRAMDRMLKPGSLSLEDLGETGQ